MKIAVPTRNNIVDDHFGHCEYFTIFKVEEKEITKTELLRSHGGCGCKSNIIEVLYEHGVRYMLAGNMGIGAYNKLSRQGIKVIRGCSGDAKAVTEDFLNGKIEDKDELCAHPHDHGHNCQH